MRPLLIFVALLSALSLRAADKITIHGYVVAVNSPTSFTVDDYSVTTPNTLSLDFAGNIGPGKASLQPGEVRVGSEVEITGELNAATHQMKLSSVKVIPGLSNGSVKGTALLDKPLDLAKTAGGWEGYIFTDGKRVRVADSSVVTLATGNVPVTTLDGIDLDTFVHYEGTREPDGSIKASKVKFLPVKVNPGEMQFLKKFAPKSEGPTPGTAQPPTIRMARKTFNLVADQDAQDYVQKIGQSVIPDHQKELADDNPFKVRFQFYLVDDKSTYLSLAYPNGVIIVPSGIFNSIENEAQLAFLLSNAVSQVLERDLWRLQGRHRSARIALDLAAVAALLTVPPAAMPLKGVSGILLESAPEDLVEQSGRVGMEKTLEAGYDIREAPRTWKAVALKLPALNPLVEYDHSPQEYRAEEDDELAKSRDLLMTELRENYSGTDYAALRKDSEEFHTVATEVLKTGTNKQNSLDFRNCHAPCQRSQDLRP